MIQWVYTATNITARASPCMLSQQKKNPKGEKKSPKNMRNMWIEIWVSYYV